MERFVPGRGRDLTDVIFRANIADFQGSCEHDDDEVEVTLQVAFVVQRGPANKSRRADFEYFVAIPKFHPSPEGKRRFRVTVPFQANQTKVIYRDEIAMTIPLKKGERGVKYDVYIGFQLTADEIRRNRRPNR